MKSFRLMNIMGPIVIIAYIILVPLQIFFRFVTLLLKKRIYFHVGITAIEFLGLAILYILSFQNFDSYYQETHKVSKNYSLIFLFIGYFAYFINNLLIDKVPKKIDSILMVLMCFSLAYSIFSIGELLFRNDFKPIKLVLLQLPYPLLMMIGLVTYKLRPSIGASTSPHVQL